MLPGCNRILWISLAAGLLAGAEVYKWVDDNGVVHYTDTPPEGQQTKPIEVAPPAPAAPPPATIEPEADDTNAAWYEQWQAEQRARKASEQAARDISISSLPRAARTASTSRGHRRRHAQREMQNPNTR